MAKQRFIHLLTLLFKHRYFKDNLCKTINPTPGNGMSKKFLDLDIIIKPFPGGFHFLSSEPELLSYNKNKVPIRIYLFNKDNRFFNYTEIPSYKLNDTILYFNNLSVDKVIERNTQFMHANSFVGENDVVQLCYNKFNIPTFDPKITYRFTNISDIDIFPQCVRSVNKLGDFSLNNLPEDIICVKNENGEIFRCYHCPQTIWKKPLAVIEIYTDKLYYQYKNNGKMEYVIEFRNRQTIWKYFIVNPVYKDFNNLTIINKDKEQNFSNPVKQKIHDNQEALVFESNETLPFSEISNTNYRLVEDYVSVEKPGKVVLKKLVDASPDMLYRDLDKSETTLFSHIYI